MAQRKDTDSGEEKKKLRRSASVFAGGRIKMPAPTRKIGDKRNKKLQQIADREIRD